MANTIAGCAAGTGARSARTRGPLLLGTALSSVMLSGVVLVGLSSPAVAQQFWDGADTTVDATPDTPGIQGGSGTWDATTFDWTNAAGDTNAVYSAASPPHEFGGATGGTVQVSAGGITLSSTVNFAATGDSSIYVISGPGAVTVGGAGSSINVVDIDGGAGIDALWDTAILTNGGPAVTDGVTKGGGGTLELRGVNTFTGQLTVNGGGVDVSAGGSLATNAIAVSNTASLTTGGGALASTAVVTLNNAGAFTITGNETVARLGSGAGATAATVTVSGAATTLTVGDGSDFAYDGMLAGTGHLTKQSGGRFTLTNDGNTISGTTTVSGGILQIDAGGALGTSAVSLANGAELDANFAAADSVGNTVMLTGSATVASIGAAAATFTGGFFIGANTLTLGGGANGAITTGTITGIGGSVVKTGGGAWGLSSLGLYTGTTTIANGVLFVGSDVFAGGSIILATDAGGSAATFRVTGPTTIDNNIVVNAGAGGTNQLQLSTPATATLSGSVTLNAGVGVDVVAGLGQLTMSGAIGGGGGLTKTGPGTLVLSNANSYTGTTTITAGTLSVSANANLGANAAGVVIGATGADNAVLALNGTDTFAHAVTVNAPGGAGSNQITAGAAVVPTISANVTLNGALTVDTAAASAATPNLTVSGQLLGAGALTKTGTGQLLLSGSNTAGNNYTGTVAVGAGVLQIGNGVTFGDFDTNTATLQANAGGRINLGNATTIAGNVVNNGGTISAGASPATSIVLGNYTVNAGSTELFEFTPGNSGVVGGGVNDFVDINGDLAINAAGVMPGTVLALDSEPNSGTAPAGVYRLYRYGGTATFNGGDFGFDSVTGTPNGHDLFANGNTVNVRVFGTSQLTQYYDGTDTAGTANAGGGGADGVGPFNWDGSTINWSDVPAGTLNTIVNDMWRGQRGVFGGTAGTVNVVGTQGFQDLAFTTNGYVLSGGTIQANGEFNDPNGVSAIDVGAGLTATIASVIADNGTISRLEKTGTGTLVLTGANLNTQPTRVVAGTLQIGDGGMTGRIGQNAGGTVFSNVTIDVGATLEINRDTAATGYTYGGNIAGGGALNVTGPGTIVLTGTNNLHTGAVAFGTGGATTERLVLNSMLGGSTLAVTNGGVLAGGGATVGSGGFGGDVTFNATGGTIAPGGIDGAGNSVAGTLTVGGNLVLDGSSVLEMQFATANAPGGATNDLISVGGGLTLDGTLNITGAGLSGYYRVADFRTGGAGAFVDNGLVLGTMTPAGTARIYTIDPGGAGRGEVNVAINLAGQIVQYWDGGSVNKTGNGVVEGGTGTWSGTLVNWTDQPAGSVFNDTWQGQVGVFTGAAGTVTVAGVQNFQGLQFTTDGYVVNGPGTLNMTGNPIGNAAASFFNIDAGVTTTVNAGITGAGIGLDKIVGTGTLILGGANTYTGLTTVGTGTLTIANTGSITSSVANAAAFNNNGQVTGGVTNAATGTFANTGTVTGNVSNANVASNSATGVSGGAVTNTAAFANAGAVNGGLANNAGGNYTQTGGATSGGTTNVATVNANGGAFNGAIANNAPGVFNVGGTVTSDAASTFTNAAGAQLNVNAGSYTMAGTAGTTVLDNAGALTVAGGASLTLTTGNLVNSGTILNNGTITDDLINTSMVTNNGIYNATVASNTGTITNNFGATWNGGVVSSTGTINNYGTWAGNITNGGLWNAALPSPGGATTVTGSFANNGTINLQDGDTQDVMTVTGTYSGTGQVNMDIALNGVGVGGAQQGDRIVVGGDFQGATTFNFTNLSATQNLIPDILVADLNNGQPNPGTATATGLPNGGLIQYALIKDAAGDWVVRAAPNLAAIGGIAGNVSIVQATIGAIVNRPSSPFVSGMAAPTEPGHCGPGPWMRATGGGVQASGTATSPLSPPATSQVTLGYAGAQFGLDLACFNVEESGVDVAAGAIAGANTGVSSQPITGSGITNSNFSQGYGGAYATIAKGQFSADIQGRIDYTAFTFNNPNIGLSNAGLNTVRYTLSGSASYAIPVQDMALVPTAGFSLSRTDASTLTFNTGQTLTPNSSVSAVGFVGATLAKTIILPDQVSAVTPFATATLYNDFAPNPTSTFYDPTTMNSTPITSQHLGALGEVSLGLNYVKILEGDGPRQINATVRADARFSDRVLGAGITGQVRAQF